jgi:hypothetical protein
VVPGVRGKRWRKRVAAAARWPFIGGGERQLGGGLSASVAGDSPVRQGQRHAHQVA